MAKIKSSLLISIETDENEICPYCNSIDSIRHEITDDGERTYCKVCEM